MRSLLLFPIHTSDAQESTERLKGIVKLMRDARVLITLLRFARSLSIRRILMTHLCHLPLVRILVAFDEAQVVVVFSLNRH